MQRRHRVYVAFAVVFLFNMAVWYSARDTRASWANVPPVPEQTKAASMALGDRQLAYRSIGIMLQNLGDSGGRVTPLAEYDYARLKEWFFLADSLDPVSDYVPLLAARYFGSTQDPSQVAYITEYLDVIGQRPVQEKWRWLSHAVILARHSQQDLGRAYILAQHLAALDQPGMPAWTDMMPALVLSERGDKELAYEVLKRILADRADRLHPNEVNHIVGTICEEILTPAEALRDPLCGGDGGPR